MGVSLLAFCIVNVCRIFEMMLDRDVFVLLEVISGVSSELLLSGVINIHDSTDGKNFSKQKVLHERKVILYMLYKRFLYW